MYRCSTSYVIREMHIKAKMRYYSTHLSGPNSRILTPQNSGEQQKLSFIAGENENWYSHLEHCLAVSYKIKHAVAFLGIYSEELNTYVHTKFFIYIDRRFVHNFQNLEVTKIFYR